MKSINLKWLIVTVFGISWLGVLPKLLIAHGVSIPEGFAYFDILMTLGPLIGAVLFIYRSQGKSGLKAFFSKLLKFKASVIVIAVAILLPIIIPFISSVVGLKLSGTAWPVGYTAPDILINGLSIFLMYVIINTEELVWRGLVFDKFLEKHGYLKSCLLLIPIWWLFHMPLFLFPEGHQAGYGLAEFTFIVIAQTFILGWIYVKTAKSLFYVHMHHQLINGFGQAFPIFPVFLGGNKVPFWIFCALLMLTAGILVSSMSQKSNSQTIAADK